MSCLIVERNVQDFTLDSRLGHGVNSVISESELRNSAHVSANTAKRLKGNNSV